LSIGSAWSAFETPFDDGIDPKMNRLLTVREPGFRGISIRLIAMI
jgi:hypothetical protein